MAHVLCVSLYMFSLTYFTHQTNAVNYVDFGKLDGKDKYFPGRKIETLKPIGFQQCLKVCGRNTNCLSINYNKEQLTCELLSTAAGDQTHLETRTGYVYTVKEQKNVCKELHCNQTSRCFRTSVGSPVCLTKCPRDCQDIEITKVQANKVQRICPFGNVSKEVQCETNGTHIWTVIQRRFDGSEDFYRTWAEYKNGFGNASGEYWIGNDVLHALTTANKYQLVIESVSWQNETAYGTYTNFSVADEDSNYTLSISGYSGSVWDAMVYINGKRFSTKDTEDICSNLHRSGWWFGENWEGRCTYINPNGEYHFGENETKGLKYIFWYSSLRSFVMKIQHNF